MSQQAVSRPQTRLPSRRGGRLPSLVAANLGPTLLKRLPGREQEIATIVYLHGEATAKEIEYAVSDNLTNSAIRSMLSRLVAKGVLHKRKESKKFIYRPAICDADIRERAVTRLVREYYNGSIYRAALALIEQLARQQPESIAALLGHVREYRCDGEIDRSSMAGYAANVTSMLAGTPGE